MSAFASSASAATRYAAPGGTGANPCEDSSQPCSLYLAADQNAPGTTLASGDVVEMAPGTYTEDDLGPNDSVQVASGVTVRGEPGAPRPLIVLDPESQTNGAFYVGAGARVAGVEIRHEGSVGPALTITIEGIVERVLARSTASTFFTCQVLEGTLRDSVCLSEGGGIAMGASSDTFVGTHTVTLRNVTAIATGIGSRGADFAYFASAPGTNVNISAKSALIKGDFTDVMVRGQALGGGSTPGANTVMTLDHSLYAEAETFTSGTGTASVTPPGTNDNITADQLLAAADDYHQLPGSPTVDKGAADFFSGLVDVDGQQRTIGPAPDIGADELRNPSTTSINCNPSTIQTIARTTCTVSVEDTGIALVPPTGSVSLPPVAGLNVPASCTLVQQTESSSSCSVLLVSTIPGTFPIAVRYGGDGGHEGSEGSTNLTVFGVSRAGIEFKPPETQLRKHPPKRTRKRSARFTFGSDQAPSRFECKLDKKPFRACSSPYRVKVKPGKHRLQVRAVSAYDLLDPTPAVFRWRVLRP